MKHIQRTATIQLNAPPEIILPLFTAVGEHYWIEDWNPEYVYPETGEAATGMIFKTKSASRSLVNMETSNSTIWVTVAYEPTQGVAAYVSVTPDVAVVRVDIHCYPSGENQTSADITYTLTALSDIGEQSVQSMTEMRYQNMMTKWEQAINHYLAHGTPMFQIDHA